MNPEPLDTPPSDAPTPMKLEIEEIKPELHELPVSLQPTGEPIALGEVDKMETIEDGDEKKKTDIDTVVPLDKTVFEEVTNHVFKWHIKDFGAMRREKEKEYSPDFEVDGVKWRALIFPRGNRSNDSLSVYLDALDAHDNPDPEWHRCVSFAIGVQNVNNESTFHAQNATHRFDPSSTDWGFTTLMKLTQMYRGVPPPIGDTKGEAGLKPIIENEEFYLVIWMRIIKDETGVLWHKFENWDSRKKTGYVGLKNQGATCYMNSLLQSLYFTNYFRRATFEIPTEKDDPTKSISLALQRVFYNLQVSPDAVGTIELTKSFGWDTLDSFMQHDVQEFNRVLQDNLESKMKGTKAEGAISKLFTGKMKSYIRCINVPYESSRVEDFYDIQLNVKGCKNLTESFDNYVAVETLDGDNKYAAEGYGLQDAKKGVIFCQFPPVLHLQLKRFEYDIERDAMVKINDRHEYPLEIDLDQYLDEDIQQEQKGKQKYHLHAVLVHSGDLHGGHYCAFIRPNVNDKWYKFDDDRVIPATKREVFDDNFGGEVMKQGTKIYKRFTNAYMLVYVRDTDREQVLAPISQEDIPEHLRKRLDQERAEAEERERERLEAHMYLQVKVLDDAQIRMHKGFDLCNFGDGKSSVAHTIKFPKAETLADFRQHLATSYKVSAESFRLWTMVGRQNKTVRPDAFLSNTEDTLKMEHVFQKYAKSTNELRFYVEFLSEDSVVKVPGGGKPVPMTPGNTLMLFLKYYNPLTATLQYLGHIIIPNKQLRIGDIVPHLLDRAALPPGTPIRMYEEVKPEMIDLLKPKNNFMQAELGDGDIICFQREVSKEEAEGMSDPSLCDVTGYFDAVRNRVTVVFKERGKEREDAGVSLVLSKKHNYGYITGELAKKIGGEAEKIRLLSFQQTGGMGTGVVRPLVIKFSPNWTLEMAFAGGYPRSFGGEVGEEVSGILVYERLEIAVSELETKRYVRVFYVDVRNKDQGPYDILLPKTARVADIISDIRNKLDSGMIKSEGRGCGQFRVLELTNMSRVHRELRGEDGIQVIREGVDVYVQEITAEEQNPLPSHTVLQVIHFNKDPARGHGIPFRICVVPGEVFGDTKKRLCERMGMGEKEFGKVRWGVLGEGFGVRVRYLEDDDVLHDLLTNDQTWVLGADHVDRSGRNGRVGGFEKAIKIFG